MSTSTQSFALKNALYAAAQTLFAADPCIVTFGHPGPLRDEDDIIALTAVRSEQQPGPMSNTNRSRDEIVYLTVMISCWRAGEQDNDLEPSRAVYDYMSRLETYVRKTDTTLGGNCYWCFVDSHTSTGISDAAILAKGRLVEAEVEFKAFVRITQ